MQTHQNIIPFISFCVFTLPRFLSNCVCHVSYWHSAAKCQTRHEPWGRLQWSHINSWSWHSTVLPKIPQKLAKLSPRNQRDQDSPSRTIYRDTICTTNNVIKGTVFWEVLRWCRWTCKTIVNTHVGPAVSTKTRRQLSRSIYFGWTWHTTPVIRVWFIMFIRWTLWWWE